MCTSPGASIPARSSKKSSSRTTRRWSRPTYREIVETRQPHYWLTNLAVRGNPPVRYARLMVPLSSDGVTVDMLMGVFFLTDPPSASA